jgi:hypothetical protein
MECRVVLNEHLNFYYKGSLSAELEKHNLMGSFIASPLPNWSNRLVYIIYLIGLCGRAFSIPLLVSPTWGLMIFMDP